MRQTKNDSVEASKMGQALGWKTDTIFNRFCKMVMKIDQYRHKTFFSTFNVISMQTIPCLSKKYGKLVCRLTIKRQAWRRECPTENNNRCFFRLHDWNIFFICLAPYRNITTRTVPIQSSRVHKENVLTCKSEGYPKAEVIWQNGDYHDLSNKANTSYETGTNQLYHVTSTLTIDIRINETFRCIFWNKQLQENTSAVFIISGNISELKYDNTFIVRYSLGGLNHYLFPNLDKILKKHNVERNGYSWVLGMIIRDSNVFIMLGFFN